MKRRVWQRADTIAAARAFPEPVRGQRSAEFCVDHPSPASRAILIAPVFMTRNAIADIDIVPGRRNCIAEISTTLGPPVVLAGDLNYGVVVSSLLILT